MEELNNKDPHGKNADEIDYEYYLEHRLQKCIDDLFVSGFKNSKEQKLDDYNSKWGLEENKCVSLNPIKTILKLMKTEKITIDDLKKKRDVVKDDRSVGHFVKDKDIINKITIEVI